MIVYPARTARPKDGGPPGRQTERMSRVCEEGQQKGPGTPVFYRLVVYVALVGVYVLGVALRWGIVGCLRDFYGDLPYTLESALLFRYADMIAKGERLPRLDKRAQYPEGLEVERKLSLGKDIAAAGAYRALGRPGPFREFVRRFDAAWFCVGIFAVFLVVREMGGGELGGLMAAALYAISVPSVIRSTGLEFSRENFSLPLIFLHVWLMLRAWRRERLSLSGVAAGIVLALAAATWDATQLYVLLVGVFAGLLLLFGKSGYRFIRGFLPGVACLAAAAIAVPYLREHGFMFSGGMVLWYSLTAAWLARAAAGERSALLPKVVLVAALACLTLLAGSLTTYPETYSHFPSLFLAKLKHLNVKPLDPAKLSYEARILWTPALHSATSKFLERYPISDFEVLFALGAMPFVLLVRSLLKRSAGEGERALVFWLVVFLVLYVLFVRMEVFLAFFVCCLIGLGVRYALTLFRRKGARAAAFGVWAGLVLLGLIAEKDSYSSFEKIYRAADTGSPYAANKKLVGWLRENTEKDSVVLANFTLEPTIFADAERAIVLHPKFESKDMRLKVKEYLEALFSETEKDFHDFCIKNGVNYYVLHPGVFSGPTSPDWIYSHRYMVDRAERRPEYATLAMQYNPDRLQYFKKLMDVAQAGDPFGFFYRVFKVISRKEIEDAEQHCRNARMYLDNYMAERDSETLQRAETELLRAVELFPGSLEGHSMLSTVYTLRGDRNKASQEIERCKRILSDRRS